MFLKSAFRRGVLRAAVTAATLAAGAGGVQSKAQVALVNDNTAFLAGVEANLFFEIDGTSLISGATLELPSGWTLERLALVHRGRQLGASWTSEVPGVYRLSLEELGPDHNKLVIGVRAPRQESVGTAQLDPVMASEERPTRGAATPLSFELSGESRIVNEDNLAARFDATRLLEVDAEALPLYDGDGSFTLEFWIKTTSLDQVVMSGWDGKESTSYPAEVVLGSDGRLFFFRGSPGRHVAMSSKVPVADGSWHHVAVSHDEVRGWSRLLIDAVPTDSLFGFAGEVTALRARFCVGGRCASTDGGESGRRFVGMLDDVRVWPTSRTERQIALTMVDRVPAVPGMLSLVFEETPASGAVVGGDGVSRQASDFLFHDPVEDVSAADAGDAIEIRWRSRGRNTAYFAVERSDDGSGFVEVARFQPDGDGSSEFMYLDEDVGDDVIFYRVRQVLVNGGKRFSATVKMGLGGAELPDAAAGVILGNFPNPFSTATTISFEVAAAQRVNVSVWDLSGHQVATVLDASIAAGKHEVTFVPDELPSGTYFARLQTDATVSTRKIILAK
ncbi:MAG: T9SS type A sorting domain-containing protein [Rhodothermia bacterium]|nr:T9SS type A sorting domain-containing protein [Rhodothermia bacterium]